ncbi:hypothetical protein DMB44_08475 [Thermoplasma sp. Kam2015]|uniref:hypothetical protein n=1 Tax=Thermoplasma sp. Kam2015 TaxID=2094122 RepID=UPI000D86E767|nr:hypothetical protein [Thermoplasma sp. Kam2015]PYB67591.1 hypothetical protein DMB44_08475 [Thermoplasma sp. Kam2015]
MITFRKRIEVEASADEAFRIISDPDRITEFWKGTRRIIKEGKFYRVRFAFPAWGIMSFHPDADRMSVLTSYLKGPIRGSKIDAILIENGKTLIQTEWNVRLSLYLRPFERRIKSHFEIGAEHALLRIKEDLEKK